MGLEKITEKTRVWSSNLDIVLPIDGRDVPDFREWINWSGWQGYSKDHNAFDFACYMNNGGNCILGLSEQTPVRAVADGYVAQISEGLAECFPYATFINIEHSERESGLFSAYTHVTPKVKSGTYIKKGDVIATLYKDEGEEKGKLVHLHFELINGWDMGSRRQRMVNPENIYQNIGTAPKAEPQGSVKFKLERFENQPKILIANFRKLSFDNS